MENNNVQSVPGLLLTIVDEMLDQLDYDLGKQNSPNEKLEKQVLWTHIPYFLKLALSNMPFH